MVTPTTTLGEVSKSQLNWIIHPIGRCVLFLAEEIKINAVIMRSVIAMESMPTLIGVVRLALKQPQLPLPANIDRTALDSALRLLADNSPASFAGEIQASDFAVPNAHSLIGLWSVIEVCMEDTFTLIIMNDASARQAVRAAHPKLNLTDNVQGDEEASRRVVGKWERLERGERSIATAWRQMLTTAGIAIAANPTTDAGIAEVNAVRNTLMHRQGRIDERAAQTVPALKDKIGQEIKITRLDYARHFDVMRTFTNDVMGAIIASRYVRAASP